MSEKVDNAIDEHIRKIIIDVINMPPDKEKNCPVSKKNCLYLDYTLAPSCEDCYHFLTSLVLKIEALEQNIKDVGDETY